MVKKLGIAFLGILAVGAIMAANKISGNTYVTSFIQSQSIQVVATVIAINVATVTFLIGNLVNIEQKAKQDLFSGTKTELKQNIGFMFAVFFVQCLLVTLSAKDYPGQLLGIDLNSYISFATLMCIFLIFYALAEIVIAVFRVADFLKTNK